MTTRTLGTFNVSPIGYGAMPLSMGGNVRPDERQAIATVHAALDAGITLVDTADIYAPSFDSMGHNERLVARALASWQGDAASVVVATKGGITRGEGETWGRNGTRDYLRSALDASLIALDRDVIDLYYWHRPDRWIRYADAVESLATFKSEGLITNIGISNANVEEIQVAIDVLGEGGLAAVQNEFSPSFHHTSLPELEFCGDHGIAYVMWSPLGGTSGGAVKVGERFPEIAAVAISHGVSPQQVTLAWELALGEHVIPIPGASRPASVTDSAAAMNLMLDIDEIASISRAILR